MWLLGALAVFFVLILVGRQVRLGRLASGPWFRQFRAARGILGLLALMGGTLLMLRGAYLPGLACLALSAAMGGTVRLFDNRRSEAPEMAATYTAEEIQAYRTLNLGIGADHKAVTEAWKRLMKKAHPDQGGSADRAKALNAARDLLLRRV